MTREEAGEALDRAVQDYIAAVFVDDGPVVLGKWVLVAHVDLLESDSDGYTQACSDGLALHERIGLLSYAKARAEHQAIDAEQL